MAKRDGPTTAKRKSSGCWPLEAEYFPQLYFADAVGLILFECEGFESAALRFVTNGFALEMGN